MIDYFKVRLTGFLKQYSLNQNYFHFEKKKETKRYTNQRIALNGVFIVDIDCSSKHLETVEEVLVKNLHKTELLLPIDILNFVIKRYFVSFVLSKVTK